MANYRQVILTEIPNAPVQLRLRREIAAPRTQVWELLSGDPARWGGFFPGFDGSGHWLDRTPEGVGSVRQVRAAGLTFRESVLAHDEATRWAFRLDVGPPVVRALAEDYLLEDAPGGCALHWTIAVWPYGPPALVRALAGPGLKVIADRMAAGLERVTVEGPGG